MAHSLRADRAVLLLLSGEVDIRRVLPSIVLLPFPAAVWCGGVQPNTANCMDFYLEAEGRRLESCRPDQINEGEPQYGRPPRHSTAPLRRCYATAIASAGRWHYTGADQRIPAP